MDNTHPTTVSKCQTRIFRRLIIVIIIGLVLSGVTAFPLVWELRLLTDWIGPVPAQDLTEAALEPSEAGGVFNDLKAWLWTVRTGLENTQAQYPWIAYGTDWLAFGHLVIAVFFVGPYLWPRRDHRWTLISGMIACVGIVPLAAIAGEVRGIPWGWRLIDCCFAVGAIVPLAWALHLHKNLLNELMAAHD